MAFRFHRSVRLGPLLRLNVSKSGLGLSLGVRGARVSINGAGVRTTVGAPGTGLSVINQRQWGKLGAGSTGQRRGFILPVIGALVLLVFGLMAVGFGGLVLWAIVENG
jgi:hypothetical protein